MTQFPNNISNPIVESSMREWRESKYKMQFVGSRCEDCGAHFFPHRFSCGECNSTSVVDYKFKNKGTILNYTIEGVSQISVMGFEKKMPRVVAIIELEKKVAIVGEIVDIPDLKSICIGDYVEVVLRKMPRLTNGMDNYAYKFKKIGEKTGQHKKFAFDFY